MSYQTDPAGFARDLRSLLQELKVASSAQCDHRL
jgi:hypothetical protein